MEKCQYVKNELSTWTEWRAKELQNKPFKTNKSKKMLEVARKRYIVWSRNKPLLTKGSEFDNTASSSNRANFWSKKNN